MMNNGISFALPKGRLAENSVAYLEQAGIIKAGTVDFNSRKLMFFDEESGVKILLVRNIDVPTYVARGVAEFGVVGKDVLEENGAKVYELIDLGFGKCHLSVAAREDSLSAENLHYRHNMRIATTFPNITKMFFASKGLFVDIVKLYGSVEIAPLTGLADYIVDLVDSGDTLRKNGLKEIELIMESSARLISNTSLTMAKHERMKEIIKVLRPL